MRRANSTVTMTGDAELELLQRLRSLGARFRDGRDADKALRFALRLSLDFFGAGEGCVAVLPPGRDTSDLLFAIPKSAAWDQALLAAFIRGDRVRVPPDHMLARIRRRGRMWGALCVRDDGASFKWDARRALSSIAAAATELINRIDEERIHEVRARIDRKIMEQLRPKDLAYQILHGLRSLIDYDHSASLLMCDDALESLEIVAEQIAWRKGKSQCVGMTLPVGEPLRRFLRGEAVYGFDRDGVAWSEWTDHGAAALGDLLDFNLARTTDPDDRVESAMLCAPLITRDGVLGLLKVATCDAGALGPYEAMLVARFLPQASVALQNAQRTESLELNVIAAERKHAMADLARGVSHDVNNALGAVLPLVQEMRQDADEGELDPAVLAVDLKEIERSLKVVRRIFNGMLAFARAGAKGSGQCYLDQEVDCTLAILREGMQRRGIEITIDLAPDLPPVRGVQADIEQVLLNLLTNARDSMAQGGQLSMTARPVDKAVEVIIRDTGCGISRHDLAKIQEPFYTTKQSGTGLGLAICRSIVAQIRGAMHIDSAPGRGTTVTLLLPAAEERP